MSSWIWKASPTAFAYCSSAGTSVSHLMPPRIAPVVTAASSRAPVLCRWIQRISFSVAGLFSYSMSASSPAAMPLKPTASASILSTSMIRSPGTTTLPDCGVPRATTAKASLRSESPARMATFSSYFTWHAAHPRRIASLSRAGRSSWIRDIVWIISRAMAVGIATSRVSSSGSRPGARSRPARFLAIAQAAMHMIGRKRFPPARRL
mmetsp:Transcript_42934/g.121483  ORF Transcript_42934/g.121483 Transcript_42934/m.121483 type:complete len:207 (+) Transcript_42934:412-1032(+)